MGGRTFRSRWVIRWLVAFGGGLLIAAVALVLISLTTERRAQVQDADLIQLEAQCRARLSSGGDFEDPVCDAIASSGMERQTQLLFAGGLLAILGTAQLVGAARVRVSWSEPGVTVRNPLRTHRLLWSEIAGFRIERGRSGERSAYAFGRVHLVDGTSRRIEALCAMPWEPKSGFRDEAIIRELNDALAHHQAQARAAQAIGRE